MAWALLMPLPYFTGAPHPEIMPPGGRRRRLAPAYIRSPRVRRDAQISGAFPGSPVFGAVLVNEF